MIPEQLDPKTTLYPTFECFTDSMEFIDHIAKMCPEIVHRLTLVHGICLSENGREFAHAWCEDKEYGVVIFSGIYMGETVYLAAPFENYFKVFKVKESTRYTVMEAVKNNLGTVHFGPWEEKYGALCGNRGEQIMLGGGYMEKVTLIGSIDKTTKETKKGKQDESDKETTSQKEG